MSQSNLNWRENLSAATPVNICQLASRSGSTDGQIAGWASHIGSPIPYPLPFSSRAAAEAEAGRNPAAAGVRQGAVEVAVVHSLVAAAADHIAAEAAEEGRSQEEEEAVAHSRAGAAEAPHSQAAAGELPESTRPLAARREPGRRP